MGGDAAPYLDGQTASTARAAHGPSGLLFLVAQDLLRVSVPPWRAACGRRALVPPP